MPPVLNLTQNLPVGVESFHTEGRAEKEGHDEDNRSF